VGFYPWKKSVLKTFRPDAEIRFYHSPRRLPLGEGAEIATWGAKFADTDFPPGSRITRYEDGFIRSLGLGAKFTPALSWVADRRGIYYDASRPCDLEDLLQTADFPPELLERARRLRETIVRAGLTKYNLQGKPWKRPDSAKRVILVPGQVESDASIRLGSGRIRTNIAFLQTVRRENPDAYILYKPHPDVVERVRREGDGEKNAAAYCDEVVRAACMDQLLQETDEVHVITSLAGFEALLRGKTVVTYGHPFYAGWGLTTDREAPYRPRRRISLDTLVAGALLKYSLYRSATTGARCEPEQVIEELASGIKPRGPGFLERMLRTLSDTPLWHRFCAN
jgi:capsular polysaccharide export protein